MAGHPADLPRAGRTGQPPGPRSRGLGLGAGGHVGVFMYSRPEYLETMVAAYKLRAVPINVNYRYVAEELALSVRQRRVVGARARGVLRPGGGFDPGPAPPTRAPGGGRGRF